MQIQVRFFASLREQVGVSDREVELAAPVTVGEVWRHTTDIVPPANLLCARNLEYVHWDDSVSDGDEVAFFPPVTGG
jgi:molybdopterin synthase sulfur carrier subunit